MAGHGGPPARPAPRRALLGQGSALHHGRPHHDGLADLRRPGAGRGRGARPAPARDRRHPDRQDDHARVRPQAAHRQPALRRHAQPVGSLAHRGRLVRRRRRGGRHRPGAAGARHRRRGLGPHPRRVLRHRRAQADARARAARAPGRPLLLHVLHRPHGAERGGGGRLLRRDRRLRSGRSLLPAGAAGRSTRRRGARASPRVAPSGGQPARRPGSARGLRGRGAASGRPGRSRRDRGRGRLGLRADLPDLAPGRAGRPRRPAHGEVRGEGRAQPPRVRRAGRAVVGGGLGQRARPADHGVSSRAGALAALRLPAVAHPLAAGGGRRPRPVLAVDHDPYEPITIAGESAGSIRGAWYPYLWPFNLSGHPALSLPCGWSSHGLPIGLQIVGPWYGDRRVLALAGHLERERPCARPMPL